VPWDLILKLFLLKKVLASLMNNARDLLKKCLLLGNVDAQYFSAIQTDTKIWDDNFIERSTSTNA